MALKLKGIKIPQKRLKRSDRIVIRRDPGLEDGYRGTRQLRREQQKWPIQLTGKTNCVWIVIQGSDVTRIDLTQWLGKREIFENCMQERLKKYRKSFRELTMWERRKRIDEMTMEIMCCCLVRDESEAMTYN
eukprot:9219015-Ditylum_brightwellii.AAC.1